MIYGWVGVLPTQPNFFLKKIKEISLKLVVLAIFNT